MKCLEEICFLSDKTVESRFCDCEDECLRDRRMSVSIRFVLHFEHVAIVFCRDPPSSFWKDCYSRFTGFDALSIDIVGFYKSSIIL